MIENLLGGGGKGGTVDSVQAGTGISVDATDPANPIVSSTFVDTNDAAKVSSNDTTAGYLNGKLVAGTSITLTENNNGGNETLSIGLGSHTHAASDITSGLIDTARLGTGTANSTTYLAGDQTYKAAVTSVNGSTGAVTVAAGDTTYTVTTADCENTTTQTTVASFTVPANTWSDGQCVELAVVTLALQNAGVGVNWTGTIGGTGITERSSATTTIGNATYQMRNITVFRFYREGNTVTFNVINPQNAMGSYTMATRYPFDTNGAMIGPINWIDYDSSVDFTTGITINYKMQFGTANASTYVRVVHARAVKYNGGNV